MKRFAMAFLTVIIMCVFCSCEFGVNIADSLSPPKPSGELYEIQKTLEKNVGGRLNLVYPSSGNYRSAIVTKDLDGDGKTEVFSFYSTSTDDKTTVMHINYIRWTDSKGWVSVSDIEVGGSGVESVEFANLDRSGIPKIIVSWSRYSAVDKKISIYEINSGILSEVTSADYSVFSTCDFDNDGVYEIVAVSLDTEKKTAKATLLALTDTGFTGVDSCSLDGNVTAYYEPKQSKFTDGNPALFIDADKSTGLITEVLCVRDGTLVNVFDSGEGSLNENTETLRAASIHSGDINGDGSVDIPLTARLPVADGTSETDSAYMTTWNSFDGSVFTPISSTVINYTDSYYLVVPSDWINNFTVTRNTETRQRSFVRWNGDEQSVGEEILRVQVLNLENFKGFAAEYEGYFEIARTSKEIFVAKLGGSALNPGEDYIKNNFKLIDETKGS
jgi:hypothetical protein